MHHHTKVTCSTWQTPHINRFPSHTFTEGNKNVMKISAVSKTGEVRTNHVDRLYWISLAMTSTSKQ